MVFKKKVYQPFFAVEMFFITKIVIISFPYTGIFVMFCHNLISVMLMVLNQNRLLKDLLVDQLDWCYVNAMLFFFLNRGQKLKYCLSPIFPIFVLTGNDMG